MTRARRAAAALLTGALLCLAPQPAPAQPRPPAAPALRVETGMHLAALRRLRATPDGSLLVTASLDRTARVWRPDGTLVRTLRMPAGEGPDGQLAAVAVAPSGRHVVLAGNVGASWDNRSWAMVYSLETGHIIAALRLFSAPVTAMAYAPDGDRLAIGFGDSFGLMTFDLAEIGRPVRIAEDAAVGGAVQDLAFTPSGALAATATDGMLRLYASASLDRRLVQPVTDDTGQRVEAGDVAVSPEGDLLAVGAANRALVRVFDARTLAPQRGATLPLGPALSRQPQGHLRSVAWTREGGRRFLVAAGQVQDAERNYLALRWAALDQPPAATAALGTDTVYALTPLPDGRLAYGTGDPSWGVLGAGFRPEVALRSERGDFRAGGGSLRVSDDGLTVEFGTTLGGRRRHRFEAAARRLQFLGDAPVPARPFPAALPLRNWQNSSAPELGGRPLRLPANELTRSVAATPDASLLVLGTDTHLRLYRRNGTEAAALPVPAAAWGVAITPDARLVVAALGDGTLGWYGLGPSGLRPLASLFPHADGRRWILWTPEGFFDHADEGGQNLAGYLLNGGPRQAPEWVDFAQLYRVFFAPDLVRGRLSGAPEAPLRARLAEVGDVRRLLGARPLPYVSLAELCFREPGAEREICRPLGAGAGTRGLGRVVESGPKPLAGGPAWAAAVDLPAGTEQVRIVGTVADRGGGIGAIDVFLNSRNIGRTADGRGLGRIAVGDAGAGSRPEVPPAVETGLRRFERPVRLDPGVNLIRLRAFEESGAAFAQSEQLEIRVEAPPEPPRPTIHVLAVGVDRMPAAWVRPLNFAVADARAFLDMVRDRAPAGFRVNPVLLPDEKASRPAIEAAFDALAAQVLPEDTVLLYLAGHGLRTERSRYLFVPWMDAGAQREELDDLGIDERQLVELWSRLPAKRSMLLLDTCHAGGLSLDFAGSLSNESGRYVLAASAAADEALDSFDGRNGLFAAAVLEALRGAGRAGTRPDAVDNFSLAWHVRERVPQLARQRGYAQRAEFRGRADELVPFPIARIAVPPATPPESKPPAARAAGGTR